MKTKNKNKDRPCLAPRDAFDFLPCTVFRYKPMRNANVQSGMYETSRVVVAPDVGAVAMVAEAQAASREAETKGARAVKEGERGAPVAE